MRERTDADDVVQGAYNRALLELILPSIRRAAKDDGYALAVHGSLNRDIDLIAVPWTDQARPSEYLVSKLTHVIAGVVGRCHRQEGHTDKPQGRKAYTLLAWCGENTAQIDL